jgi:hypothetical protein
MEFGEIRSGVQNSAELWESIFDTYMTLGKHCQARFALKCLRRVDGFTPSFQEQALFRMVEKDLRTHKQRPDNVALLRYSILIICSHELAHHSDSGVKFATTRDRIPWHVTRLLYDRVIRSTEAETLGQGVGGHIGISSPHQGIKNWLNETINHQLVVYREAHSHCHDHRAIVR